MNNILLKSPHKAGFIHGIAQAPLAVVVLFVLEKIINIFYDLDLNIAFYVGMFVGNFFTGYVISYMEQKELNKVVGDLNARIIKSDKN